MTNKLMYFVGNWKMFGDFKSIKMINHLNKFSNKFITLRKRYKIILCLPNTLIHFFSKKNKSNSISIGAQNCHHLNKYGPFTGSISASMIKKAGAKYVIIGHSENRSLGETNKLIKEKIRSALKEKLNVIFCIGETYKEKRKGKTYSIIKKQINSSIDKKFKLNKIIIAYEPVWSIGTGNIPKSSDLKKIFIFIKNEFRKKFKIKSYPIVLYGGSVDEKNIRKFSLIREIDGFLVGKASQSHKKFIDIITNYYK